MLNDFYTAELVRQEDGKAEFTIGFSGSHSIFDGHFPGQPVVPGVCTTHIAKTLLERTLGIPLQLREARQIKFLQLLTPDTRPLAAFSWTEKEAGIYSFESTWTVDNKPVYKLSATLIAK